MPQQVCIREHSTQLDCILLCYACRWLDSDGPGRSWSGCPRRWGSTAEPIDCIAPLIPGGYLASTLNPACPSQTSRRKDDNLCCRCQKANLCLPTFRTTTVHIDIDAADTTGGVTIVESSVLCVCLARALSVSRNLRASVRLLRDESLRCCGASHPGVRDRLS